MRAMQELAKSLEALGLSTLDGLTKKELRKVKEAIIGFSDSVREPVKNVLADFAREGGGGYPPFPLRVFGHNDFPLRGGGTPQFR